MASNIPLILDVGDGFGVSRPLALEVAQHVLVATSLVTEECPLSEMGLDMAATYLAAMLGGPEWNDHASTLIHTISGPGGEADV
jgi:hypothetical protein